MSDNPEAQTTPAGTPAPEATDKPLEQTGKVFDEAYVKSLRDEAAAARVDKKTAVEAAVAAAKAEHQAELAARDTSYTELQNELGQSRIELEKIYTSIDAKVPSDKVRAFVEILKGDDKDSIAESAKAGLQLFGGFDTKSPAFDPTHGFGGRHESIPLNGDPILAAIKRAVGI